jgi:thioredoxin 1
MSSVVELDGNGLKRFLTENQLAVVNFYRTGCRHCAIMEPIFQQMAADFSDLAFAKVDIVSNRALATSLDIYATPTFVTYRKGTRESMWEGDFPEDEFRKKLSKAAKGG